MGQSCFLKSIFNSQFTHFLKSYSLHYKTDYYVILKHNIAKLFSIIEESEGIFGPKTNDPRLEMVLLKNAPNSFVF